MSSNSIADKIRAVNTWGFLATILHLLLLGLMMLRVSVWQGGYSIPLVTDDRNVMSNWTLVIMAAGVMTLCFLYTKRDDQFELSDMYLNYIAIVAFIQACIIGAVALFIQFN